MHYVALLRKLLAESFEPLLPQEWTVHSCQLLRLSDSVSLLRRRMLVIASMVLSYEDNGWACFLFPSQSASCLGSLVVLASGEERRQEKSNRTSSDFFVKILSFCILQLKTRTLLRDVCLKRAFQVKSEWVPSSTRRRVSSWWCGVFDSK
jgi:hypothetical protein